MSSLNPVENSHWLCRDYPFVESYFEGGAFLCKTVGKESGQHWGLSPGCVFLLVRACPVPRAMGMHSVTTACTFYFSPIKTIIQEESKAWVGRCFQILDPLGYIMSVSLCNSAWKAQTQHDLSFVRAFGLPGEGSCIINGTVFSLIFWALLLIVLFFYFITLYFYL